MRVADALPHLVLLNDYGGDWDRFLKAVYAYFKQDFIDSRPVFNGRRLGLKRHPVIHNKEATFWHFTSEGEVEAERTPDFRRCERIRWPKPLINQSPLQGEANGIKVWKNKRVRLKFHQIA